MSTPDRKQYRPGNRVQPVQTKIENSIGIKIEISDTQGFLIVDTRKLVALARRVLEGEGTTRASISLVLVDNATIHRLNRQHLGHDWPTDVISYTLSGPDDSELAAEIVISAEMAAATAHTMSVAPADELALYVVHGLLHLCGYDDRSEPDILRMRDRENQILNREDPTYRLTGEPLRSALAEAPRVHPAREGQEPPSCSG
jgi:probable rRNA maturation factor